jgi:hypothetical protein
MIAAKFTLLNSWIAVCAFVMIPVFVRFVITNIGNFLHPATICSNLFPLIFTLPVFTGVSGHKKNGPHVWKPFQENTISSESDCHTKHCDKVTPFLRPL